MTLIKEYHLECDGCGDEYYQRGEYPDCIENLALNDGWITDSSKPEMGHICPECRERFGVKNWESIEKLVESKDTENPSQDLDLATQK